MGAVANVQSVNRIIYAILIALTKTGKTAPSKFLHMHLDVTSE